MIPRRRRLAIVAGLLLLVALLAFAVLRTPFTSGIPVTYRSDIDHFKYGSIGSEGSSGIPYWAWQAMPRLFPEDFAGRSDYAALGFLYERDAQGRQRDLPIGVSRRNYRGIDMVWLNCAVCHAGTWRADAASPPRIVVGMPSNNLDFDGFIRFLLTKAAVDQRLSPESLMAGARQSGARFGPFSRWFWTNLVGPQLREGLVARRARMAPWLEVTPPWGPGRVDTFNPYKLLELGTRLDQLSPAERVGTADFPSIFNQRAREGMQLHWDGNNRSLMERNLSAAIGAGVTPGTIDIDSIRRMSDWLLDLRPPPSPHRPDPAAVARGRTVYMGSCAACHGFQQSGGYVFSGRFLGRVTPIAAVGTDRNRLDSYTEAFRRQQLDRIFEGTPYDFRYFTKTDGYANQPLDGLWLRGPYLHNGSVPTLADLLQPPGRRPAAFVRGLDIIDRARGGFLSPACNPATRVVGRTAAGRNLICFDTAVRGNGNGGHLYGTGLPAAAKLDLLAYLRTF